MIVGILELLIELFYRFLGKLLGVLLIIELKPFRTIRMVGQAEIIIFL